MSDTQGDEPAEFDEAVLDEAALAEQRSREMQRTAELVAAYQGGEDAALEELFARYYDRVLRIVRIRMGKRIRARMDSVDIVQNTFGAAMTSLKEFEMREPGSLIHWLAQIAENQLRGASDYLGALKRDSRREVAMTRAKKAMDSGEYTYEPQARTPEPLEELTRLEREDLLDECVAELPPDYREVILLRDFAGASWEYITEQMGRVTPRATAMLHARAKVALLKIARHKIDL
ncbi:MAG: sigma-70 family RNA polymerase sigma factor [Planctomycetes bacterium]|nr:sigma-70 family RNA polymerase sigma factor [Planctomycetota bacterium]